jgi:UDP-3-O-[3-hydroxymyristoyl] glucosamine N-acyltransferase
MNDSTEKKMTLTIAELARRIGARMAGTSEGLDRPVEAVQPVAAAGERDVTFVSDSRHEQAAAQSAAAALIVARPIEGAAKPQLVVADVNAGLIAALTCFAPQLKPPTQGVHPSALVGANVKIGKGVSVGPYAVIEDNVQIGADTVIAGGCHIGQDTQIGTNCRLDNHVVIYHHCRIGNHVVVQANSTIGSVGFGYAFIDEAHRLIPHNGGVVIEDFVEIGANSCVDRAKFGNTIIGAGTKIDNLVQVGHNVVIGKCCLIAAQVGIAGSCKVGDGVVLAGQVGLADNIEIGAGTMVGAQAGVVSSVPPQQKVAWTPAIDVRDAARAVIHILRLPKVAEQLKHLTAKVEKLEAAKDHKG